MIAFVDVIDLQGLVIAQFAGKYRPLPLKFDSEYGGVIF